MHVGEVIHVSVQVLLDSDYDGILTGTDHVLRESAAESDAGDATFTAVNTGSTSIYAQYHDYLGSTWWAEVIVLP